MKTISMSLLVLLAGTTGALAAPRESADLVAINGGPISSFNWQGDAGNTTVNATFTGSDGGGAYAAKSVTVTGTVGATAGASYFREACILITPPGGTPFIAQPINIGTSGTGAPITNTVRVEASGTFTTAGVWSFQFFDYFDDVAAAAAGAGGVNGADAQWTAVSVTLDDASIAPAIGAGPSTTLTNVDCNGLTATPGFTTTWNNATSGAYNGFRVSGVVTALNANPAPAANTNADLVPDMRVRVTPPGGVATVIAPVGANARSSSTFDIVIAYSGTQVGAWGIDVFENADLAGVVDNTLNSLTVELVAVSAPANEDLGTLTSGVMVSDTETLVAGQTKWYKFTTTEEISIPQNKSLSIDTVGSTAGQTTGAGNTSVGLFNAAGDRVATDFADGAGSLGCLSFGNDPRVADPAVGTDAAGVIYNGRDSAFASGTLLPGTYFLAVTAGDTGVAYGPSLWGTTNTSTVAGSVTTNILFKNVGATPTNPAVPTVETNLGKIVGGAGGVEAVTTYTVTGYTAANQVKWIQFNTGNICSDATGFFMDIDTEGTTTGGLDTEIALYHANGVFSNEDDDDGSNLLSSLTYGDSLPIRPATGAGTGLARNGRDGILPVDTYYLAVGRFNFTMPIDNFNVTSTSTATAGNIVVNFRTNLPAQCSPADVGVQGGGAGQDNLLNNDDFVAFIDLFFANDPRADVGVQGGGPGSDGQWNNDDFVAFIDLFFAGGCNG